MGLSVLGTLGIQDLFLFIAGFFAIFCIKIAVCIYTDHIVHSRYDSGFNTGIQRSCVQCHAAPAADADNANFICIYVILHREKVYCGHKVLGIADDVPFFVKDYSEYYKGRAYHARSLNSNDGWNVIGCESFMNQPILKYSCEIRSAVLVMHGEKAHSFYFGKDAFNDMVRNSKYAANKEFLAIPGAVHTDLYDNLAVIPFDKMDAFFKKNLD